jgi:hypothetical protein
VSAQHGFRRWTDDRLDGLERRVDSVVPVVTDVAVIKNELKTLGRDMRANTLATERATEASQQVSKQLEQAKLEPLQRARNLRTQLLIGVLCAMAGGGMAILGALVVSH